MGAGVGAGVGAGGGGSSDNLGSSTMSGVEST